MVERNRRLSLPLLGLAPLLVLAAVALGLWPLFRFALEQAGLPWPDAYVWRITRFTLLQASLSTLLSILPAIFVARALARRHFQARKLYLALLAVPLVLPAIVALFGLTAIYGAAGPFGGFLNIYGLGGIVLAHVFFNLPLAARMLHQAIQSTSVEQHRLAAQLGFGDHKVFLHLDWPVLRAALPRLAALVFLLCAGSFVVVLVLGGPAATTLEVAIYQSLRMDFDVNRALMLALVQILLSAGLVFAASKTLGEPFGRQGLRVAPQRFDGASRLARITDYLTLIAVAVLVLPIYLVILAQGMLHIELSRPLFVAFGTSLAIALLSTLIALPLSWGMAKAQMRLPSLRGHLIILGLAGFIVPPAVLGMGWFLATRALGGNVLLTLGLITSLNVLMCLPFSLAALAPPLADAAQQHDMLAASLGIRGLQRLLLIDLTALRAPLAQCAMLSLVLSMGDLTAVTLLGSDGIITLPGLVQQQMGHYQSDAAGGTALVLGLLSLTLALLANRLWKQT